MNDQQRTIFNRLHMAARVYNFGSVSNHLLRLLQHAKLSEKPLGEQIYPADHAMANIFWAKLFKRSSMTSHTEQRARDVYCVIWSVERGMLSQSIKSQAGAYCDAIAECCEQLLQEFAAPALPKPEKKPHSFRVIQGSLAS